MRIQLRGRRWILVRHNRLRQLDGTCDIEWQRRKRIVVSAQLTGRVELETFIHEMSHACFWDIDEPVITQQSRGIASVLWAAGCRRSQEKAVTHQEFVGLRRALRHLLHLAYPYLGHIGIRAAANDMAIVLTSADVGYRLPKPCK